MATKAIKNTAKTTVVKNKKCSFCESKKEPSYTDSQVLRKFMSDRNRILSHARTGVCSKHQRAVAREIKHARHLALLPFVASI